METDGNSATLYILGVSGIAVLSFVIFTEYLPFQGGPAFVTNVVMKKVMYRSLFKIYFHKLVIVVRSM